jgi:hypothetical protein
MRSRVLAAVMLAGWCAAPGAIEPDVDLLGIDDALAIARDSLGPARARFHEGYRAIVAQAPVDWVEIVTPFRRIVLAAQASAARGERTFGQRQALETLAAAPGRMDVHVELTFHPLNTYIGVPDYDVRLVGVGRSAQVRALGVDRLSRWTPRIDSLPPALPAGGGNVSSPRGQALVGGTLVARFDVRDLEGTGVYEIGITDGDTVIARTRIDLSRLR